MTVSLGMPTPRPPIYAQPRERYLFLYPTTACQLRCRHCYVGNDRLNEANTMSLETAIQIMDYFKITGGHDKLYILGGEPTLHPQLPEIVIAARQRGYQVTVSSNGDFDEELFGRMPPMLLNSFNFSLESADPAVHRRIRGNPHNFEQVTNRIRGAAQLGYQIRIQTTVSRQNREGILDLIPFLVELGASTLSFHILGRTGNGGRFLEPLTPTEWMEFCAEIEAYPPRNPGSPSTTRRRSCPPRCRTCSTNADIPGVRRATWTVRTSTRTARSTPARCSWMASATTRGSLTAAW
jgi:MoaA/NifB/PqqE/SkfB family radical SAM enzyme